MIKIENLTIQYGKRIIIKNQNLELYRGSITGIKGESGAGKSSLLNVLGLLKQANKGCRYFYDNERLDSKNEKEASEFRLNHIGFIFQQGNLLTNLTTIQNVKLPLMMCEADDAIIDKEAKKWIDYVNLGNLCDSYPEDLSGGEEQRIAIARALINDCDVILADEPTASLDKDNAGKVMKALQKLAYELNKIVVVVSHDDNVINFCDCIYEIKNCKLEKIKDSKIVEQKDKAKEEKKKKINLFTRRYEIFRRKEYRLNRILIAITAIIIAMASLSFEFGKSFTSSQKDFINSISDRRLLVINDTLGINATTDYGDALAIENEIVNKVKEIPNVESVYQYYEFNSYGMTTASDTAKLVVYDGEKIKVEKNYENTYLADGNEFSVAPIFPQEDLSAYLLNGNEAESGEIVLTYTMALELSDNPKDLIGKELEIFCFVPTKIYLSEATKPKVHNGEDSVADEEKTNIDGYVTELVKIRKKIVGVLNNSYKNDKSQNNGNIILMNCDEMYDVLEKNKDVTGVRTFPDYEERALNSSMLVVYTRNFDDLSIVQNKISSFSPSISIINKAGDINKTQMNLNAVRNTMICISLILVIVIIIMFSLLYFYKNRERNKEIGILKALGLSKNDVLILMANNMIKNTVYTILLASVSAFIIQKAVNGLMGMEYISINAISIVLIIAISFLTVFMSGMFSIRKTSRIEVIDAIRLYRK